MREGKMQPGETLCPLWQRPWFDALCILAVAVPALFISGVNIHDTYEDAYITYRYAYNLATGHGFVYNVGERFLGTTAPLYGLILGILGLPAPHTIPAWSGILSMVALTSTGLALYAYGRIHREPLVGLLAGLFYVTNPLLPLTLGGEMPFQTALIAWAFVAYCLNRSLLAAALLALATLTRPDGAIALGVVGFHALVVRRRWPWREVVLVAAIVFPFALASWLSFGTVLPDTLAVKLSHRDAGMWLPFTKGLFEWSRAFTMQGSSPVFGGMLQAAPHMIRFILLIALGIFVVVLVCRNSSKFVVFYGILLL